jgi:predicted transcriptional regulator
MVIAVELSDKANARIEAIAARSTLTPAEIIRDVVENGLSLDWQEAYLDDVERGIAAADRGEFASDDEIARVLNKYRPT